MPYHQGLDHEIDRLIRAFTKGVWTFGGSRVTEAMREVWRQGVYVEVLGFLERSGEGLPLETIVKRAAYRAWRKDVVSEFMPWIRERSSRVRRVDAELSWIEDRRNIGADEAHEIAEAWESALDALGEEDRDRVETFCYGSSSISQVAAEMGVAARTIYRALAKFRRAYERARRGTGV